MNNDFWKQQEKQLLERFTEPNYVKYEIVFTDEVGKADLKISCEHNIFDYLAIGMVCIFKETTGCKEKKIYVQHRNYPSAWKSGIQVFSGSKTAYMRENALSDLTRLEISKYLLHKYFKEDNLFRVDFAMPDFFFYTDITSIQMGLLRLENVSLDFEHFEDTVTAQKLAFNNLKNLLISHWLGSLQEFYGD